ncbi:MAG: ferredoxin Fer [Halobacteriaceae archaeon]
MESPFDVLGVDPDADEAEIERAYRRRVKEAHPDHGGSTAAFREVRAAYEQLTNGEYEARERDSGPSRPTADSDPDSDSDPDHESTNARATPVDATVEYLNFDVLDDHGWAVGDPDLFRKAAAADLDSVDYGEFTVPAGETVLDAAEATGQTWPFACRGGACANCAVVLTQGEMMMAVDHILPEEMLDRGIRLSCIGKPTTPELQLLYNVKHLPDLDDLRLPPGPFEAVQSD